VRGSGYTWRSKKTVKGGVSGGAATSLFLTKSLDKENQYALSYDYIRMLRKCHTKSDPNIKELKKSEPAPESGWIVTIENKNLCVEKEKEKLPIE